TRTNLSRRHQLQGNQGTSRLANGEIVVEHITTGSARSSGTRTDQTSRRANGEDYLCRIATTHHRDADSGSLRSRAQSNHRSRADSHQDSNPRPKPSSNPN